MKGMHVRPAKSEDASAALNVLRDSIATLCVADHKNDPEILQRWLSNKTPEQFSRWLSDQDRHIVVAELGSQICGVGMVHRSGDLDLCYVQPTKERRGVGAAMMSALESQAKQWRLDKVKLISTVGARSFYERLGYAFIGVEPADGDGLRDYYYAKTIAADV
jgi:GNAT superfamily N-acetyltransferase